MAKGTENEDNWDGHLFEGDDPTEALTEEQKLRRMLALLLGAGLVLGPAAWLLGSITTGDSLKGLTARELAKRQRELVGKSVQRAQDTAQTIMAFLEGTDMQQQTAPFTAEVAGRADRVTDALIQSMSASTSIADAVAGVGRQLDGFATTNQQVFGYALLAPLIADSYRGKNTAALSTLSFTDGLMSTVYGSALRVQSDTLQADPELGFLRQQLATLEGRRMLTIPAASSVRAQVQEGVSILTRGALAQATRLRA